MSRSNKPYGAAILEDFTGEGEWFMNGEEWTNNQNYFKEGAAILVKATVTSPPWNPDRKNLHITQINFMADVKDVFNKLAISFTIDSLTIERSDTLSSFFEEEGSTELYLKVFNSKNKTSINLKATRKINISRQLLEYLDNWKEAVYKLN